MDINKNTTPDYGECSSCHQWKPCPIFGVMGVCSFLIRTFVLVAISTNMEVFVCFSYFLLVSGLTLLLPYLTTVQRFRQMQLVFKIKLLSESVEQ